MKKIDLTESNLIVEKDAYLFLALSGPTMLFAFFNLLYARILGSFDNNKLAFKINAIGVITNVILDSIIYIKSVEGGRKC